MTVVRSFVPQRAFFRADACARTGGGHLMRCLTLADQLRQRGVRCEFVCAAIPPWLRRRLEDAGHDVHVIASHAPDTANVPGWELVPWAAAVQDVDAAATMAAIRHSAYGWAIVDHYRLDASWERIVAARATRLLAIDDLANRLHAADMVLDQTPGRVRADYDRVVPAACCGLFGTAHALLRPEFLASREGALRRRQTRVEVERILISLGATDAGEQTVPATMAALAADGQVAVDVVVGSSAPSLSALRALAAHEPRLSLHVDARDMATLIAHADLAIGAAGTSSWERCCLGLPTLVLILAENQRLIAKQLEQNEAAVVVNDSAALEIAIRDVVARPSQRRELSTAAALLVDGLGAARVADAMEVCSRSD